MGSGITKDQTYKRIRKETRDSRDREHNSILEEQTDRYRTSKQKARIDVRKVSEEISRNKYQTLRSGM